MSLSILLASREYAKGELSWNEYIHQLMARCAGISYEVDKFDTPPLEFKLEDPFAWDILMWADDVAPIQDTTPLEAVFRAYRTDSLDVIKSKLAALDGKVLTGVRESLSYLALKERRSDVLEMCLEDMEIPIQQYCWYNGKRHVKQWWITEARHVEQTVDPKTFRVLEQNNLDQRLRSHAAWAFDSNGPYPVDW